MVINGKTVLITGASSGIGEATARAVAANGAAVYIAARWAINGFSNALRTEVRILRMGWRQPESGYAYVSPDNKTHSNSGEGN